MKNFFTIFFAFLVFSAVFGLLGFILWCSTEHNTSVYGYIKNKIEDSNNKENSNEIVTENEDGTVTAIINF